MKVNGTQMTLSERVESIDMLRGFALLGIFIANMLHFSWPYLYMDPYTWFTTPSDVATLKAIKIGVEGSFYPIFAMLFGYGLNMQYEKSTALGNPFGSVYARRMTIMMFFGLAHALFIWYGDILFSYALMGFIMIAVVRIPKKWMLIIATAVYAIPSLLLYGLFVLMNKNNSGSMVGSYADIQQIELSISAYAHGTYGEIFSFRLFEWLLYGLTTSFLGVFIILPLIMIGAALSKYKVFERASQMKGRIAIIAGISLVVGVLLKYTPYFENATMGDITAAAHFGGPIVSIAYVGILLLLVQIPLFRTVFRPISKAGRMSLTTYITQSIVATTIFYSYGFGMYGKIDLITGVWIAVGVFAIQVIFAELWLSKFRMGPLEWVWRKGTYGKKLKNKEGKEQRLS